MSWDFDVVCDRCKVYHHLGQSMGGLETFGFGSNDEEGRAKAAKFIVDHLYSGDFEHRPNLGGCGVMELRIVSTEQIPEDYRSG